jgi:hypothetical protein
MPFDGVYFRATDEAVIELGKHKSVEHAIQWSVFQCDMTELGKFKSVENSSR